VKSRCLDAVTADQSRILCLRLSGL